jgi:hypothetical protein
MTRLEYLTLFNYTFAASNVVINNALTLLSEYDGKTDLEIFGTARAMIYGGDRSFPKYYSSFHDGKMIDGKPMLIGRGVDHFYVFTEDKASRLNFTGYLHMTDWNGMFYDAPVYKPEAHTRITGAPAREFIINDGKLHFLYTAETNDGKFSPPVAGTYNAAPILFRAAYSATNVNVQYLTVLYDKDESAFRPYLGTSRTVLGRFANTADGLNMNSIPRELKASLEGSAGEVYNVMKINGLDSLYVFRFLNIPNLTTSNFTIARRGLEGCVDIANAEFFTSSPNSNAFVYATQTKVHSFSHTTGKTTSNLLYECDPGEVITTIHMINSAGHPAAGRLIWVATWNEATKVGSMVEFEVDPVSGELVTTLPMGNPFTANYIKVSGYGKIKQIQQ